MKENIFEVLLYLFENHLHERINAVVDEKDLLDELQTAGFEIEVIHQAFAWLESFATEPQVAPQNIVTVKQNAYRVLSAEEQIKIGSKCWGILLFFEQIRILTLAQREAVIEQLMMLNTDTIDVLQLKWATLLALCAKDLSSHKLTIINNLLPEGGAGCLH